MPLLCAVTLRHSVASLRLSVHRRCPDLPCKPCRCLWPLCKCPCIHCLSTLCLCLSTLCRCLSTLCRCCDSRFSQCCAVATNADLCYAIASTFNSVPLRFKSLRLSALSCHCDYSPYSFGVPSAFRIGVIMACEYPPITRYITLVSLSR